MLKTLELLSDGLELVQTATIDRAVGDYRVLAVSIRDAGLLDRRAGYYRAKIVLTLAAFAAGWVGFFVLGTSWRRWASRHSWA